MRDNFSSEKRAVIFENDAELRAFRKIYESISCSQAYTIEKPEDIAGLIFAKEGVFLSTKDIFESKVIDLYEYNKRTLHIQINDKKSQDSVINTLMDGGYIFDKNIEKSGTYKAEGDTLTIRTFYDDRVITLGFF